MIYDKKVAERSINQAEKWIASNPSAEFTDSETFKNVAWKAVAEYIANQSGHTIFVGFSTILKK